MYVDVLPSNVNARIANARDIPGSNTGSHMFAKVLLSNVNARIANARDTPVTEQRECANNECVRHFFTHSLLAPKVC